MIEQNFGIRCEVVESGAEAIELAKKKSNCLKCKSYFMMLIDINMPEMSGIELIKRLR